MKSGLPILICFVALCVIQWAVPASMIVKRESALQRGDVYKFKTAPVDPYDAFRGRYVALNYEQSRFNGSRSASDLRRGQMVYAILKENDEGFAVFKDLVGDRPDEEPYLAVRIGWINRSNPDEITLSLPFDRFYMDEFSAPEAERQFFRANRERDERPSYVQVRVRKGFGVIEDLFVDGQSIREWLAAQDDRR